METKGKASKSAGVSNEAVRAKTGKTWPDWFAILDKAGARKMDHKQIVAYLNEHHQVGPGWQQMVTVGYEQARIEGPFFVPHLTNHQEHGPLYSYGDWEVE